MPSLFDHAARRAILPDRKKEADKREDAVSNLGHEEKTRNFSTAQIMLMGLIFTVGPISTDMYLPAFPQIEHDLDQLPGSAQLTLTCWFVGLALGQFCLGPLSDRFGRLRPLQIGLIVYIIATIILAMTHHYGAFCLMRFISALGGAICSVAPRAIVRDVATGREAVKLMSQLTLVFGVGPILAPSLGSLLLALGHWRLIFWACVIAASLLLLGTFYILRETLPPERRFAIMPSEVLQRYLSLLREPVFLSTTLLTSFCSFVMFAYLANAPQLFEHILAFTPREFAIFFGVNAGGFILATQINGRLARRFSYVRVMETGIFLCLLSALALLAASESHLVGRHNPWPVCVTLVATTFFLGFISPNAGVMALAHHGHQAGAAAALLGTLNFGLGGSSGILMAFLNPQKVSSTAIGMLVGVTAILLCDVVRRRALKVNPLPLHEI